MLVALASHLHGGSQFVLAGRTPGRLPIPRILAGGRGTLIDTSDLQLSDDDAGAVLLAAGVDLPAEEVSSINRSTEGWPVGLYLTALSIRSKVGDGTAPIRASPLTDQLLGDYIRTEILSRLTSDDLGFLLDASALERFSGPLCDSVMERKDSAARLSDLARANLLLIRSTTARSGIDTTTSFGTTSWPSCAVGTSLGFMHCMPVRRRGMDPAPTTRPPSSTRCSAGDIDLAAQLLPQLAQRAYNSGRVGSLRRWFEALDQGGVPLHHSDVAVVGAILFSLLDDRGAGRSLGAVPQRHDARQRRRRPRDGHVEVRPSLPVSERRRADARRTLRLPSRRSQTMTNGDRSRCYVSESQSWPRPRPIRRTRPSRRPCVPRGTAGIAQGTAASALVYRAVIAIDRGDWDTAARFAAEARAEVDAGRVGEQFPGALADAVDARVAIHRGDPESATRAPRPCPTAATAFDSRASVGRGAGPPRPGPCAPRPRRCAGRTNASRGDPGCPRAAPADGHPRR